MLSTDELQAKYEAYSDDRLQEIIAHPGDYRSEAVKIAEICLLKRGLSIEGPESDWTQVEAIREEEADVEDVSLGMKIVFFLLPGIAWLVILVWFAVSLAGKADRRISQSIPATIAGTIFWGMMLWLVRMVAMTDYRGL